MLPKEFCCINVKYHLLYPRNVGLFLFGRVPSTASWQLPQKTLQFSIPRSPNISTCKKRSCRPKLRSKRLDLSRMKMCGPTIFFFDGELFQGFFRRSQCVNVKVFFYQGIEKTVPVSHPQKSFHNHDKAKNNNIYPDGFHTIRQ